MKTEYFRFKLGIKIYQLTGYITHFVRDVEEDYLMNNLDNFLTEYDSVKEDFTFEQWVSLQKGLFQCKIGLYRKCRQFESGFVGKIYRKIDNFKFRIRFFFR